MQNLKVGDRVLWRGNFGTSAPRLARVTDIEVTERPREKYGTPVDSVDWDIVRADRVVVTLDTGHWAYGSQLEEHR